VTTHRYACVRSIAAAAVAALLLAGCGSTPTTNTAASSPTVASPTVGTGDGGSGHATPSTPGKSGATTSGKPSAGTTPVSPSASSTPIPLTGTITPTCVRPGAQATIVVQTLTKSAVAFDTYYSNGKTGGTPPFGDGLGGNASGMTDRNGRYTASWIVSPNAPAGAAYARVVVGHGDAINETKVPFAVSDPTGDC
jgi:hypothetical protein